MNAILVGRGLMNNSRLKLTMVEKSKGLVGALGVFAILLAVSATTHASIVTLPPGLNRGDQYRLVFVTSTKMTAASNVIGDYNTMVSNTAGAVSALNSLGTTWSVIGTTTSVNARTNTLTGPSDLSVPIYALTGLRVATGNTDLWDGTLENPMTMNELGNTVSVTVWTGTNASGLNEGWTFSENGGNGWVRRGLSSLTNSVAGGTTTAGWTGQLGEPGNTAQSLYAMSGIITAVPEPATLGITGGVFAFGVLVLRRSRRTVA